jgi:WD40 repeat protein
LALSPDHALLASGSWDHTIWLWDVHTGAHLHTLVGHEGFVTTLAFSQGMSDGSPGLLLEDDFESF